MSAPASPPPFYSTIFSEAPISWLPPEVVACILFHLPRPLDLYQASLVCTKWRAIATDPRLWQEHYWAFYRPSSYPETDEERLLANWRTSNRRKAMRAWVALLDVDIEGRDSMGDLDRRLCEANVEQQSYKKEAEKTLPMRQPVEASCYDLEPGSLSYPAFLAHKTQEERELAPWPNFYGIFARRLNRDQRLLEDLRCHVALDSNMLDSLLQLIERYGDSAKDLLFALCAQQQLTVKCIRTFVDSMHLHGIGSSSRWPRALDVHTQATSSQPQPHLDKCISLRTAAEQVLGHLQRRDALRHVREIQERGSHRAPTTQTLKERVEQSCMDVEQALLAMALFKLGEPSEISAYLDLLAVQVWAELSPQVDDTPRATTTRQEVLRIEEVLHRLGFGQANNKDIFDFVNCFINMPLCNPAQRIAPPFIFSTILCAVCLRLGVAAALVHAPGWIVVIEEGPKPDDWPEGQQDWDHFYLVLSEEGNRRHQLREASSLVPSVADLPWQARGGRSGEEVLQPASPVHILTRLAGDILRAVQRHSLLLDPTHANEADTPPTQSTDASPRDDRTLLRAPLCGHSECSPWPLLPAVLPSSLAVLRARTENSPRPNFIDSLQNAVYCALWILRVAPTQPGGDEAANGPLASLMQASLHFQCDVTLLLEAEGCDVQEHLGLVRKAMKMAGSVGGAATYEARLAGGSGPSYPAKSVLVRAFGADVGPNEGLGGRGGSDGDERERHLLDPAHASNVTVQHRVGTLFTHRQQEYRAVVIGWDRVFRSKEGSLLMDPNEEVEREQPFYYAIREDGSRVYVAQSNIEVARVPAYSTVEEAEALLRGYLPLLNLRKVERCFATISVASWMQEAGRDKGVSEGKEEGGS